MNKEIMLDLSFEDLAKYFRGTYLRIKILTNKKPEFKWKYIHGFDTGVNGLTIYLADVAGHDPSIYYVKDVEINFDLLETGAYQGSDRVILYKKSPKRHAHRGMIKDSGWFYDPVHMALKKTEIYQHIQGLDVWNAVNCQFLNGLQVNTLTLKQAIQNLNDSKHISTQIDSNFFVSQGLETTLPCLWYRSMRVGEVDKNCILVYSSLFAQELQDDFPDYQIKELHD